ncbi:beta-glucosidase 24-like [Durio zibethinus]|uniref:Beta-glucosidase 24-like n=1 Tax=Durio zibethinus TaxID=66656 RepID=A0A6P5WJD6_DURZI|nr:beta-glucosidase 24-like [Durio zibethinus]
MVLEVAESLSIRVKETAEARRSRILPISSAGNCQQILIRISAFALLACLSMYGQITQASQKRVGSALSNSTEYLNVKRSNFPSDFVFGASTAAAQIEGSTKSGGKGPSVWDQYVCFYIYKFTYCLNLVHQQHKGDKVGYGNEGFGYRAWDPGFHKKKPQMVKMSATVLWVASRFMEPLLLGQYPLSMRRLVKDRLPVFTAKDKELVKGSFDFIGINYYTSRYAKHIPINPQAAPVSYLVDQHVNSTVDKDGVLIGPNAGGSAFIYVYPQGLYKLLKFMTEHYNKNLTIYITENGFTEKNDDSIPIPQALNDQDRIEFDQKHLHQIRRAINNGMNVKGYFYYSLFDDFEWSEGFTIRYGLYYVDFKNLKRIPKKSAKWYHDFVQGDQK